MAAHDPRADAARLCESGAGIGTPQPSTDTLPVLDALPRLLAALDAAPNALLVAPPGAGKTTGVPPALLGAAWRGNGRILVLEPRRLAARAAASRMAALRGEEVGDVVGLRTRLDARTSERTRIEVVTEGLLVRRLLGDPVLDGVAAVLFDEAHERAVEADLALALCLDLQRVLRPELRLLAMSATPDGARLASLLGGPVIESEGRRFPVSVEYAARDLAGPRELPDAVARAIRVVLASHEGDVLAFLPGMAEIRRAQAALAGCGALVLPLHGDLPPAEQDRALRPAEGRRVVLATSVAETSLTVPGVRVVVDGGWRRSPRLDPATGLSRLTTLRVSRAAADQRAGRAGREAPGVAVRLWTEALHRGLTPHDRPEILEAELSGLLLDCLAWGAAPQSLPFPDPPPGGALAAAAALLDRLGATRQGAITEAGRRMAALGAHPRLASMMLAAGGAGEAALAADLAALLEERDPLRGAQPPADVVLRLDALAHGSPDADGATLARIRRTARQYRRRLRVPEAAQHAGDPGTLLAAAFPDRIAQARGEPGSYRLSGGGSARLAPTDPLARQKLLAVAALDLRASPRIRLAAALDPAALPPSLAAQVEETRDTAFDSATGTVLTRQRRRLGALVLEDRTVAADPAERALALARAIAARLDALPWTEPARQLQARAARLREFDPSLPDLADPALAATVENWLLPHLDKLSRLADLGKLDLVALLRGVLGREAASRLDRHLPTEIALPGGRAAVDYTQPVPVASARAQAFYGLQETPVLAGGRVPLRLALLSPAGRPIAVTADLAGFWRGAWADARRDMRGRYPKHDWPEHPGEAAARPRR
jgi:ATP-dependent helicase HrpB